MAPSCHQLDKKKWWRVSETGTIESRTIYPIAELRNMLVNRVQDTMYPFSLKLLVMFQGTCGMIRKGWTIINHTLWNGCIMLRSTITYWFVSIHERHQLSTCHIIMMKLLLYVIDKFKHFVREILVFAYVALKHRMQIIAVQSSMHKLMPRLVLVVFHMEMKTILVPC